MPDVHYLVPKETQAVLGNSYPISCDNIGLILDRYLPFEAVRNGRDDMVFNQAGRPIKTIRADWLHKLAERTTADRLQALQTALFERWQMSVEGAPQIFVMQNRTRLIVGLGGKGALEFGITLHHTTGLPIIPGSALKGAARSYALWSIAAEVYQAHPPEHWQTKETLDALDQQLFAGVVTHPDAEIYRRAFGSQEHGGECVFHESVIWQMSSKKPLFNVDVMTPHFTSYYTDNPDRRTKAPHDGDNPNPVSFLTVSAGTYFGFAVGARHGTNDPAVTRRAAQWLALALDEMGIGSKTAAGYGAFKLVEA